eukprot:TRINITY_DN1530_c0_g1_i1.p2 TRINITY_DN1530_c0_g1~~TRINITY_DN1530_c0_g1_i1.p2  ORF type:complete len:128 (-),score=22.18 TRINITY_DN1530_c0_g1_i1:42-425(-)
MALGTSLEALESASPAGVLEDGGALESGHAFSSEFGEVVVSHSGIDASSGLLLALQISGCPAGVLEDARLLPGLGASLGASLVVEVSLPGRFTSFSSFEALEMAFGLYLDTTGNSEDREEDGDLSSH